MGERTEWIAQGWELRLAAWGGNLLAAALILLAGSVLAGVADRAVHTLVERAGSGRRAMLAGFLARTARMVVLVLAGVLALAEVGLDIGPLIAGVGVTGFVVGFAFKDSLANLAAGLLLLFYQPFDVGETVEVGGVGGVVLGMSMVATELRRDDGVLAIIPNGKIWNAPILNWSRTEASA